jgi:amidohydrolase
MNITREKLHEHIDRILSTVTDIRHQLHQHPEIAGNERETRKMLLSHMEKLNVLLWQPKLDTDLVVEIPGEDPGRVIGLRADMDALPISEQHPPAYGSKNRGLMHACGHDGHMAMLLGAAMVLSSIRDVLPHTVRFIFQPGEEVACMGAELTARGVCDGLEAVYALHNWPGLPAGVVSTKPGTFFAAANTFSLRLRGTGTHGATPEKGNNPLIPAAVLVEALTGLHEQVSANKEGVVSVCMVEGGHNTNVIPSDCTVAGTTRYIDTALGDMMEQRIRQISDEISRRYSMPIDIEYERKYHLPLINDPAQAAVVAETAVKILGEDYFLEAPRHAMTAEDFAFYLDKIPGCMFRLGAGQQWAPLHAATFDFNDEILKTGILMFCALALGDRLE